MVTENAIYRRPSTDGKMKAIHKFCLGASFIKTAALYKITIMGCNTNKKAALSLSKGGFFICTCLLLNLLSLI